MKTLIQFLAILIGIHLNAQCFEEVSVGYEHTLVIKNDGTLWGWGSNLGGALGLNSPTPEYFTPQLINNSTDWNKVFAGTGRTSFAIKNDGTLWAWGTGTGGRLGFGNQDNIFIPTQLGTDTDWEFIASGSQTIAQKTNGTLWGWGVNIYGQLNLNTNSIELLPVQISTETDWEQIVCGDNHTLALKTDGTLWACGLNDKGQLGDGTTVDKLIFTQIGTDNNWEFIHADFKHSIAIKTDGTIWGWGSNFNNVLGLPSNISFVQVPTQMGSDNDWAMISSGYFIATAIKTDGTLWENDENGFYQVETDTDWNFIDSGQAYSFMMKTDGTLWGKGGNDYGQLGIGQGTQGSSVPLQLNCSTLGLIELSENESFGIYPNPSTDIIYISNKLNYKINNIRLYNSTGKIVLEHNNDISQINVHLLQNGIYFLLISSDYKNSYYKIIKK